MIFFILELISYPLHRSHVAFNINHIKSPVINLYIKKNSQDHLPTFKKKKPFLPVEASPEVFFISG